MLETIRAIAWEELSHAYGEASDVPDMLLGLTSPDPAVWVAALDDLQGTVLHQGSVYSATAAAVPFLLELLGEPEVRCRGNLLGLLADALGRGPEARARMLAEMSPFLREHVAARWAEEAAHGAPIAAILWRGWRVLVALARDGDPRLRIAAPQVLSRLAPWAPPADVDGREAQHAIVAVVREQAEAEAHPWLVAGAAWALAGWAARADVGDVFERLLDAPAPAVRITAAFLVIDRGEGAGLARAVDELAAALADPAATDAWFEPSIPGVELRHNPRFKYLLTDRPGEPGEEVGAGESLSFPWLDGRAHEEILARIPRLAPEARAPFREPLLRLMAGSELSSPLAAALRAVSGLEEAQVTADTDPTRLTDVQRRVLEGAHDRASFWATMSHVDLRGLGIACSWSELGALLGRPIVVTSSAHATRMLDELERGAWASYAPSAEGDSGVTDVVLRHIGSDVFMPLLGRFPRITRLEIGPHTTDGGFASLPDLPHVSHLSLSPHLTEASLSRLRRFRGLRSIHTSGARLSIDALAEHGVLDGLAELTLLPAEADADAWALAHHRSRLSQLRELCLGPGLTDAAIDALGQLTGLSRLSLARQALSDEGSARLRALLPTVRISLW